MSVLSAQSIRELCITDSPLIFPFVSRGVINGKSFGLSSCGYDIRVDKFDAEDESKVTLAPGSFMLASSLERLQIPTDVVGLVKDKSSWAREGLAVQNTVLEPGWAGFITLELTMHRPFNRVRLESGDAIAQVMFFWLDEPTDQPYSGKYQNQANKPIGSIYEGDI